MRGFLSRHCFYSTVVPSPYRVPVAALATVLVFQGFLSGLAALLLLVCHDGMVNAFSLAVAGYFFD